MTRLSFTLAFAFLGSAAFADDWPQWRGPKRDGISQEKGLLKEWPKDGPTVAWKAEKIGTGYSSPSIVKGKVYIQTSKSGEEFCLCLDEKKGEKVWETKIGKVGTNRGPQYPGTRATPTVDGDAVYCLASDGQLSCLGADGKEKWTKNIATEFKGSVGSWAYTESVLIDGDALICTPGGSKATLAALKKSDGSVIWESAVPGGDTADYASIMVVEAGGKKQYVQYMRKALVGVDAKDGKFLWSYNRTQDQGASILTPIVDKSKVFVSGSRTGGGCVELSVDGDKITSKELFFDKKLGTGIGGAVLIDGYLYACTSQALFCADFKTGEIKWSERGVGAASICYAEGFIYARGYDSGDIALVKASSDGYKEAGKFKQPDRSKIKGWPHPVVANGKLYVRDWETLLCFDISEKK